MIKSSQLVAQVGNSAGWRMVLGYCTDGVKGGHNFDKIRKEHFISLNKTTLNEDYAK